MTKSFQKKYDKLIKEENDIKEKLKNEVTKAKDNLEKFLSLANNEIKLYDKINKGIKIIENEEKNIFRTLSYITKINKNKKSMNKLSQELIKSLNFFYKEDENDIKYEENYLNGNPNPFFRSQQQIFFSNITFSMGK